MYIYNTVCSTSFLPPTITAYIHTPLIILMEEATKNESKASSEEAESAEQVADDAGTGRFYECMFCRRGFTTAQALGGHMNIHRKDRVRMRQTPAAAAAAPPARKFEDGCSGHGTHPHPQTYANHVPFFASVSESMRSYSMYFPPTAAPPVGIGVRRPPPPPPLELSLFGEAEVSLSLGRRFDGGRLEEGEEREKGVEELDLELRLGHHEP